MKFCPFLVAGQSMAAPQTRSGVTPIASESAFATPDVDAILHDESVSSSETSGLIHFSDTPVKPGSAVPRNSMECLGDVCRFFNAGGCRFDALFESQTRATFVAHPVVDGVEGAEVVEGTPVAT